MTDLEFGTYLKTLRKDKKLTIRQLEDLSGVSNAYLSQLENGKKGVPSPEILEKLSPHLDVAYNTLMKRAGYIEEISREELEEISKEELEEIFHFFNTVTIAGDSIPLQNRPDIVVHENDSNKSSILEVKTGAGKTAYMKHIQGISRVSRIMKVPILGHIAAGAPILAEEHISDWTEVPNIWNYEEGELFMLEVKGDSMIGSRIYEGDKVLVKVQQEVENGEIAVVNVNGDDATLKKVKKINGQTWLFATNDKYDPILIEHERARIIGKVIQVIFEPK